VAQSRDFADYIRLHVRPPRDPVVIHPPVFGKPPFPRYDNFDHGLITIVNPCALKGISIFVAMARALPQVQFAAVPTWGTTDAELTAMAELPNIEILAASEQIDEIFARTRVLLVPSLWREVFPLIPIEAMARGIPVIASDSGGLRESLLGVDHVLPVCPIVRYSMRGAVPQVDEVPPQDIGPWVDTLSRLLADRTAYERLADHARDAALEFIGNVSVEQYEKLLLALSAESESPQDAAVRTAG
jgi:glycosyltransferase involved in cell wall biosynthesis